MFTPLLIQDDTPRPGRGASLLPFVLDPKSTVMVREEFMLGFVYVPEKVVFAWYRAMAWRVGR